jgi:hypothetical protein
MLPGRVDTRFGFPVILRFFSGWFLRSISKMGLRVLDFYPYMFQCIQTEAKCTEKVTKMISGHWEILVKASLTFDVSAALMGGI